MSPTSSETNTSSCAHILRNIARSYSRSVQVNVDDGFLNLMTSDGTAKDDVRVPEGDLGKEIQEGFDDGKDILVTIVSAMGEEQAISWKEAPKGA